MVVKDGDESHGTIRKHHLKYQIQAIKIPKYKYIMYTYII